MTGTTSGQVSPAASKAPGPTHVQVPDDLAGVSDAALVLWILFVWYAGKSRNCNPSLPRLQADLGRAGSDPRHIAKLVDELVGAGFLRVRRRTSAGKSRNEYEPLCRVFPKGHPDHDPRKRWTDVPAELVTGLSDMGVERERRVRPEHIVSYLRWMRLCRSKGGWTSAGYPEVAKRWGLSLSTVRRHREFLVRFGVVEERVRRNATPLTAPPGGLPVEAVPEVVEPPPACVDLVSQIPVDLGHESPLILFTDPRLNYPDVDLPRSELPSLVPVGTNVAAVDARERGQPATPEHERSTPPAAAPCRPTGARPGRAPQRAWAVVAALPRPWRDCPQWVRRAMAHRIDRALAEHGPASIVAAVARYAPEPLALAVEGGPLRERDAERHTRALDAVLVLLAADTKAGHCADCGHHHRDASADGCGCCAKLRTAWLTGDDDRCVSCDGPGATVREGLPMGSAVCDPCWSDVSVAA